MSIELIERLVREAGFVDYELDDGTTRGLDPRFGRFAALVAEECAKTVESTKTGAYCVQSFIDQREANRADFAAAIRAKFKEPS